MYDGEASEQESEVVLGQDERKPRSLEEPSDSLGGRRGGRGGKCQGKSKKTVAPPTGGDDAARDLSLMRAADFATKVPRHHFPLGVVAGSLALVLRTGTRLKRVASVLALNWSWWADGGVVGTYYSATQWRLWATL
jgi:hypothetical protein